MSRFYALALAALTLLALPASAQPFDLDAEVARLAPGGSPRAFGAAIAIDGETAVVGAPSANAAYIFQRVDGAWTLEQTLDGPQANSFFGTAVAIRGDRVVVGASLYGYGSPPFPDVRAGAAYVYVRSGASADPWSLEEFIRAPGAIAGGQRRFGGAVAIRNDRVFVGDINALVGTGPNGSVIKRAGSVFVYTRTGTIGRVAAGGSVWPLTATITRGEFSDDGDEFGASVAAGGPRVVIGAPGSTPFTISRGVGGSRPGQALIYRRSGSDWVFEASVIGSTASDGDRLGAAVAIDGTTAIAGAPFDDGDETSQGSVTVYENTAGVWAETAVLRGDTVSDSQLGEAVAIRDNRIIGGASQSNVGFGATAFVFDERDGAWSLTGSLRETTGINRVSAGGPPLGGVAIGADVVMLGLRERGQVNTFSNVRPVAVAGVPDVGLTLSAPRPNPTAGRAALTLALDTPGAVRADLVDALGRRVRTLLDETVVGPVDLFIDAAGLAPGVYTVRVTGDAVSAVRRLTVVR